MHVIVLSLVAKLSVVASPALVGRRSEFYDHRVSTDISAISCMQYSLRRWRISELNANICHLGKQVIPYSYRGSFSVVNGWGVSHCFKI